MTSWRLVVLSVLLLLLGAPLLAPVLDLLPSPAAWHVWAEFPRLLGLARNTVLLLSGTLALALPAGVAGAVLLYRTDLPWRGLLRFLTVLTLFVPLPLLASGWQAALGSGGWLPLTFWVAPAAGDPDVSPTGLVWKAWGRGLNAAIWVHAVAALPWVILLVGQGLTWVERDLEEEALTVAGAWRVLWSVTLRRAAAAVGAAALWVALQTATEITVSDMFQVRTFAEEIYTQYAAPETDAAVPSVEAAVARAVAASLPSVVLTWLVVLVAARAWERRLPPMGTLSLRPHVYRLGALRWPCLALTLAAAVLLAGVPVASLVWRVGLGGNPSSWSAEVARQHLDKVLRARGGLVADSLGVAVLAGAGTALLALLTCWLAVGARWFRAAVLVLIAAAWATPGPTVGFGLLGLIDHLIKGTGSEALEVILYRGPSPLPVLWAYLIRFFPCAVALLWPVVRLLPRELRDAARADGAGPGQELRHVVWPLTAGACLRAGLAVGVLSLGELSAGKLVETPGSQTFAHEVFTQMHYGVTNDLAALCLVLLAAVTAGAALVAILGAAQKS